MLSDFADLRMNFADQIVLDFGQVLNSLSHFVQFLEHRILA